MAKFIPLTRQSGKKFAIKITLFGSKNLLKVQLIGTGICFLFNPESWRNNIATRILNKFENNLRFVQIMLEIVWWFPMSKSKSWLQAEDGWMWTVQSLSVSGSGSSGIKSREHWKIKNLHIGLISERFDPKWSRGCIKLWTQLLAVQKESEAGSASNLYLEERENKTQFLLGSLA